MVVKTVFLWCVGIFCCSYSVLHACTIKLRVHTYMPFSYKQQNTWVGADIEQAKAVVQHLNCRLDFVEMPWARGIQMLKTGKIDMMTNVSKNKERQGDMYFLGPQRYESIRLVSHNNTIKPVTSWQELSRLNKILLRHRGTYYGERFESILKENQSLRSRLIETSGQSIRMDLLNIKRVDGFIVDMQYANYLRQLDPIANNFLIHPLVINDNPVYLAFSKASISETRIQQLNRVVALLISNGTFSDIAKRYQVALP